MTVGNATINSGSVNGVNIGESSQSTARFTNVTATSMRVTSSLTATNTGVTISDATVNGTLTGATVDLNSGNIDGTIIGATTAADGTFTELTVDNDSGVARFNLDANSTSSDSDIEFKAAGVSKGYIRYDHNSDDTNEKMIVKVGSADRLTIDGLGKVGLGVNSSESPNAAFEVRGSLNENSHAIRITNLGHGTNTAATLEFAR